MKAVSDTTPLRYLIAIEQEHLLGQLFEKVFVPAAVHQELMDAKTPETVRHRVSTLPAWFEVRTVQETQKTTFPVTLHRGEREAILLAEALRPDVLLVDEQGRTHHCPGPESPALGHAGCPGTRGQDGFRKRFPAGSSTIESERVLYRRFVGATTAATP